VIPLLFFNNKCSKTHFNRFALEESGKGEGRGDEQKKNAE
jgi:hypothetical protein